MSTGINKKQFNRWGTDWKQIKKKKRNKKYKILISNNKQKIKKGTKNKRGIHILIVFT